ncbi:MAG: AAA family ATPase [Candidatus Firestonebacteria bacterium]
MFDRKILDLMKVWKEKNGRKPLVLRGARQVGKTSAALLFGKEYFKDTVYINLDSVEHLRVFNKEMPVDEFTMAVRLRLQKELTPGETLLFIDEIQNSAPMIKLLRGLYEKLPKLHVIAAGSLLEAVIGKEGYSFPVGRVEFAYMRPLDYFEFLRAIGKGDLLSELKRSPLNAPIPGVIHGEALKYFYKYTIVGGMPEAVACFAQKEDTSGLRDIFSSLLTGYTEDTRKYSSTANSKYVSFIIDNAPLFAGSTVSYDKFAGSSYRSREIAHGFSALEKVMLLQQARATDSTELPLIQKEKRPKKIIFLDTGLVNYRMGVNGEYSGFNDLSDLYQGRIAEQITGQALLSLDDSEQRLLNYWARDRKEGSAEVDFCFAQENEITGIEVKKSAAGSLRSLAVFALNVKNHRLIRVYSGSLRQEELVSTGKKFRLVSMPFYLLPRMKEILKLKQDK